MQNAYRLIKHSFMRRLGGAGECFVRTRLHYDAVAQDKTQKKRGQGGVYASVAHSHRKKLCQRIVLPSRVKEILRRPQDWVGGSH